MCVCVWVWVCVSVTMFAASSTCYNMSNKRYQLVEQDISKIFKIEFYWDPTLYRVWFQLLSTTTKRVP